MTGTFVKYQSRMLERKCPITCKISIEIDLIVWEEAEDNGRKCKIWEWAAGWMEEMEEEWWYFVQLKSNIQRVGKICNWSAVLDKINDETQIYQRKPMIANLVQILWANPKLRNKLGSAGEKFAFLRRRRKGKFEKFSQLFSSAFCFPHSFVRRKSLAWCSADTVSITLSGSSDKWVQAGPKNIPRMRYEMG